MGSSDTISPHDLLDFNYNVGCLRINNVDVDADVDVDVDLEVVDVFYIYVN